MATKILPLDLGKFKTVDGMHEKTETNCTANRQVSDVTTVETLRCEFTELTEHENVNIHRFETCTAACWLTGL
ncbi:MAG: hypothetical protein KDA81_05345 [Planctomycetaceae bacterium]|nr:hypothetical protein [Planctomycetaceae bacterium]